MFLVHLSVMSCPLAWTLTDLSSRDRGDKIVSRGFTPPLSFVSCWTRDEEENSATHASSVACTIVIAM